MTLGPPSASGSGTPNGDRDAAAARYDSGSPRHVTHNPDELLSRRQAAQRFGLDPEVFSHWERAGALTPHRKTPRGQVHYTVAELKRAVAEHEKELRDASASGLVLSARQLWTMVEETRDVALHAEARASAAEAEVRVLREMLERIQPGSLAAPPTSKATQQARRWAAQWEQHEHEQQR